jgi:predicted PurR-regulated permease PerM
VKSRPDESPRASISYPFPYARTFSNHASFTVYIAPSLFGLFFFPLFATLVFSVALALRSFRDVVITIALILTAFLVFSFPVYFIIKNCVEESVVATNSIVKYVNENEELQELLQDYKKSVLWNRFVNYTSSWGWEWDESKLNPEDLKRYLVDGLQTLGQHANVFFGSTLQVVTNIGSTLASAFVFLTFLFYFVLVRVTR